MRFGLHTLGVGWGRGRPLAAELPRAANCRRLWLSVGYRLQRADCGGLVRRSHGESRRPFSANSRGMIRGAGYQTTGCGDCSQQIDGMNREKGTNCEITARITERITERIKTLEGER